MRFPRIKTRGRQNPPKVEIKGLAQFFTGQRGEYLPILGEGPQGPCMKMWEKP